MRHLLLAEDSPGDVMLIREAVRTSTLDIDLAIAYDGEQALGLLTNEHYDLVILDLNIPKVDGQAILQGVGRLEGSPPIVVFTSSDSSAERARAFTAGAKDYVVKPTGLDDFINVVHSIVERWGGVSQSSPQPSQ